MAQDLWYYDQPHESGGNCQISMTREQAIAWMRKCFPDYINLSDDEIFQDWVVCHWAYQLDPVKGKLHKS